MNGIVWRVVLKGKRCAHAAAGQEDRLRICESHVEDGVQRESGKPDFNAFGCTLSGIGSRK